jgi:hypothetical protein
MECYVFIINQEYRHINRSESESFMTIAAAYKTINLARTPPL